ncbi:MAG: histidine kinase [Chitinophagaceae bacterium]
MKQLIYILPLWLFFIILPTTARLQVNNQQLKLYIHQLAAKDNKSTLYQQLDSLNKLKNINPENATLIKVHLAREAARIQKYAESLKLSYEGIEIAKKYGYDSAHSAFYKCIGTVSYYTGKPFEAILYFKKSAAIAVEKDIIVLQAANYQNIGGVSIDNKQIDTAYKYLNLAIVTSKKCGAKCSQFRLMALRLLATLYDEQKEYSKAEKLFVNIEGEIKLSRDTLIIASVLIYHAKLLSTLGKKELAIEKSEKALILMRNFKGGYDHGFYTTLAHLAARRDETGDYKESSKLRKEMIELQAKRFKQEGDAQINQLETQFKVKELEQEKNIANANVLAQKQKRQTLFFLLVGTIIIAALSFFALHQRNKKKQALAKANTQKALVNSILETEEKERTRIAKDLHDGIVQDLTAIKMQLQSFTDAAPQSLQNQLSSLLKHVDTTSKEVREISYQMMPVTLRELGLVQAINELLNRSLSNKNIKFEFNSIGVENRLPEKIETTVYRICQELINNTIKHSQATNVSLLLQLRNNSLQVTYEDNGIGFDTASVKKGIGLNSLNSRVEMINGKLEFDQTNQTGTAAYIKIPL